MKKPKRPKASDPPDYARAVYEARLLLTRQQLAQVDARAAHTARRAAELAKLRFVQSLLDVTERARKKGLTLQQAREQLRERLTRAVSKQLSDPYLDLSVQNNLQAAYNTGKVRQFLEPETKAARPFWLYDAVLDMKTSDFCRRCHGTVKPAGDRWFMRRIPPCHHRCRSTIRAITKRSASARGGVTVPAPRAMPEAGWGRLATVDWKPDLRGVDRALAKVYRSRR